jgi:glycosyltransferase involved in cell wall biosynthesis
LKILVVSDSYFIHTGFANQGRRVAAHLAENHEVGYLGWFADYRNLREYLPTKITHYSTAKEYPHGEKAVEKMDNNGSVEFYKINGNSIEGPAPQPEEPHGRILAFDKYAISTFDWIVGDFKPDIVLTIGDVWMAEPYTRSKFRQCFTLCNYIPVDGGPWPAYTQQSANILDPAINDSHWKKGLEGADKLIGYTEYGRKIMNDLLEVDKCTDVIPHGFDPTYLYPSKENARQLYLGRESIKNLDGNAVEVGDCDIVIGIISRNQPRKCHPALFEAFARWNGKLEENDPPAWIYIHAGIEDCGWNLRDMAYRFGITDRVLYNQDIHIGAGLKDSEMWLVYNSCTMTTLPAKGEGWGLSILESMACEIPVSASAYSGHGSPGGWAVGAFESIEIKAYDCEPITGINRALVDIDDYVDSFDRVLDPERYAQLQKKGANLARSLQWDNVLPKWENFIDRLDVDNKPYPTIEQMQRPPDRLPVPCAFAPDEEPKLSVIMPISMMSIPNYHQMILQNIRAVENQSYHPIELILVDNIAFGPGMGVVMPQIGHKVLRWPHKYHAPKVLNLAAQHAVGEFLFFMHSDVCLEPDSLMHMMNATVLKRNVGAVGQVLVNQDGTGATCGYGKNDMDEIVQLNGMESGTQPVDGIADASLLVSKDAFNTVGGFDESYKMTNYDVDLCLRLSQLGLINYTVDAAKAMHYGHLSHLYKPTSLVMWDRNIFMKKHMLSKEAKVWTGE